MSVSGIGSFERVTRPLSLLAAVIVGFVLFSILAWTKRDFDGAAAGLGLNTRNFLGEWDERQISSAVVDSISAAGHAYQESRQPVVLWLGASQLHSINHAKTGDELAVAHATRHAVELESTRRFLQLSYGNAGLHDQLAYYLIMRERSMLPQLVLLGLTYDDLRESELKDGVVRQLNHDSPNELDLPAVDRILALRHGMDAERSAPLSRNATAGTPQERLEEWVVELLEKYWPGYAYRGELRGWTEVFLRTRIAVATGEFMRRRVPPVPNALKRWNLDAFDALVALCRSDGVSLYVYKPPHRPGEELFYHSRPAYDEFFESLERRSAVNAFSYRDFETLIPQQHWGLTSTGRPDVFHFSGFGHEQLGKAIDGWLEEEAPGALQ